MNKILLSILLFSGYIQAQIVNIPDANFKTKLLQASPTNFIPIAKDENENSIAIDINGDGEIQESEALNVYYLNVFNSNISSLEGINSFSNLKSLSVSSNQISGIINLNALLNLEYLSCGFNQIQELLISNLTDLTTLLAQSNPINSIDLSNNVNLESLSLVGLDLQQLDIENLIHLKDISFSGMSITEFDFSNFSNLEFFRCSQTGIQILDFSSNPLLTFLWCGSNPNLEYINIKNGNPVINVNNDWDFENPNLKHICVDEGEQNYVNAQIQHLANTYCSFVPGGDYNTILGTVLFDVENDGCNTSDLPQPFVRININDGTIQGASFSSVAANYVFYTQEGNFEITPEIENPSFFTISPISATINFPDNNNNISTQDFCITANGIHPDLEIVFAPSRPAKPGFLATYYIVYKNIGNQVLSQNDGISLFYDENLMDLSTTFPSASSQEFGVLRWNYSNLMPFESRFIIADMQINSSTHPTNPVNINDELNFTTIIEPQAGDENILNNTFILNQTVVGSYDPNDITCLQGDVVSPSEIGNYLHYVIRFENTGNAPAENVVVKVEIDPNQFDSNSLQMLSTSHDANIQMTGNRIEFIFENIQLDSGGHGNILLKMKTNETLQVGDYVEKKANIYFDYNFPIETNEAETLFEALSVVNPVLDSLISIYPNPVKDMITIAIKDNSTIKTIELYDIQGRLLQTQLVNDVHSELNVSSRAKGMYFIKINTDKGSKVEKLVKE